MQSFNTLLCLLLHWFYWILRMARFHWRVCSYRKEPSQHWNKVPIWLLGSVKVLWGGGQIAPRNVHEQLIHGSKEAKPQVLGGLQLQVERNFQRPLCSSKVKAKSVPAKVKKAIFFFCLLIYAPKFFIHLSVLTNHLLKLLPSKHQGKEMWFILCKNFVRPIAALK